MNVHASRLLAIGALLAAFARGAAATPEEGESSAPLESVRVVTADRTWLVTDPADPASSIARKLPLGTLVRVHAPQESARWLAVEVLDDLGGRGWVAPRLVAPASPRDLERSAPAVLDRGVARAEEPGMWEWLEAQERQHILPSAGVPPPVARPRAAWAEAVPEGLSSAVRHAGAAPGGVVPEAPEPHAPPAAVARVEHHAPPGGPSAFTWVDAAALLLMGLGSLGLLWARYLRGARRGAPPLPPQLELERVLGVVPGVALAAVNVRGRRLIVSCGPRGTAVVRGAAGVQLHPGDARASTQPAVKTPVLRTKPLGTRIRTPSAALGGAARAPGVPAAPPVAYEPSRI